MQHDPARELPYQDSNALTYTDENGARVKSSRSDSFVRTEFRKGIRDYGSAQASANDIASLFIWSAQRFYMRQPTDSYVVFSPVRYFKSMGLVRKRFLGGFLCNRAHFHASASAISCMAWSSEDDCTTAEWPLPAYGIVSDNAVLVSEVTIRQAYKQYSVWTDGRSFDDDEETTVVCAADGTMIDGHSFTKGKTMQPSDHVNGGLTEPKK